MSCLGGEINSRTEKSKNILTYGELLWISMSRFAYNRTGFFMPSQIKQMNSLCLCSTVNIDLTWSF